METVIFVLGALILLVGGIWIIVLAFQESVWWGLGSIFVPFVGLIFAFMHWDVAKRPFFVWLAGLVVYLIGFAMGGMPAS